MKGMARVSFDGGALIMAAKTPYERQLLCEHAEASARQHGRIQLNVNSRPWTIHLTTAVGEICATCLRSLDTLIYRINRQAFCPRCARRAID